MPDSALAARIDAAVDANFDAEIAFLQELVRCPSLRGQEASAQDLIARSFAAHGYDVDRWKIDPAVIKDLPGASPVAVSYDNAWTVVGAWRPDRPTGKSLALNGHVDVVPTGPLDMWARPPFEPIIEGDWMYGRGAGDMKCGVAANLFAMAALKTAGVMPAADVYLQTVIEEECTGNGALSCFARGYHPDAALIPEPSGETLMSAQVGVVWMQVTVRGRPVHASVAGTGANAIEACVPLWNALHALEAEWNQTAHKHPAFSDEVHPINLVISRMEGGEWTSSVPSEARFDVRVGLYPDTPVEKIQRRLEACLAEAARDHPFLSNNPPEVAYHGFLSEGYVLREGPDAQAMLTAAHEAVTDTPLARRPFTGLTDARFFGMDGVPGLVYGPRAENIHGLDERVSIPSIRRVTKTIARFIADWCGTRPV